MKLLIVEDEPELGRDIVTYLREAYYSCELVSELKEAMEKTDNWDYDCIILDITLPDGSGLKVLEELKRNHRDDGVIIISAKNAIDDRINGLKMGADDFLVKPFHLSELAARVGAIIRRRVYDGIKIISYHEINKETGAKEIHKDLWGAFIFQIPISGIAVSNQRSRFFEPYTSSWQSSDI